MKEDNTSRFIDLMSHVTERPAMYQVNRVEDIYLMTLGYKLALTGDEVEVFSDFLVSFGVFVNERFDSKEDVDWVRLIRFYSASDSHSINLFNKIFLDFLEDLPLHKR